MTSTGNSGALGTAIRNRRRYLIRNGLACPFMPKFSVEKALEIAGLTENSECVVQL